MRREYPSTPDEAFEQALEGAYFSAPARHRRKAAAASAASPSIRAIW